jgi:hypothetical protein
MVEKSFIFSKENYDSNNSFLKNIFDVEGVINILVDKEFISITKSKESSWDFIRTIATSKIGAYLEENNYILNFESNKEKKAKKKKNTVKKKQLKKIQKKQKKEKKEKRKKQKASKTMNKKNRKRKKLKTKKSKTLFKGKMRKFQQE